MKILFTGDLAPILEVEEKLSEGNIERVFNDTIDVFREHDEVVVNLESPLTVTKQKIPKTGPNLKSHPAVARALSEAGITLATLANNHIMDYGESGLSETILTLNKEGIMTLGAGKDIRVANEPLVRSYGSKKVAFVSYAEHEYSIAGDDYAGVNPINPLTNALELKKMVELYDYVFVLVHGGHEYNQLPSPYFVDLLRFYASFGVSAVIAHHTHCVSVMEEFNGVPIFYGLGNFIFPWSSTKSDEWYNGLIVSFDIQDKHSTYQVMNVVQDENGYVRCSSSDTSVQANRDLKVDNKFFNSQKYRDQYNEYLRAKGKATVDNMLIANKYVKSLIKRGYLPSSWFWNKESKLKYYHSFHSEGYAEAIRVYLSQEYRDLLHNPID